MPTRTNSSETESNTTSGSPCSGFWVYGVVVEGEGNEREGERERGREREREREREATAAQPVGLIGVCDWRAREISSP